MKTNTSKKTEKIYTAPGAVASKVNYEQQLRRSVLTCLLWEDIAYEGGELVADRIKSLVPKVKAETVAALALECRTEQKLRHVPLFLVREMARHDSHKHLVAETLYNVIQRADELSEFVAIYWKDGKQPLSAQVKKGLAKAFTKFDEYALAKYNQDNAIKLRDVLFLSHAKPLNKAQAKLWKKLVNNELKTPDTWEVELSQSSDKKESWTRLLKEEKLGALAFLRNLRNMREAGVSEALVEKYFNTVNVDRVLPFRFVSAARHNPQMEPQLEELMFRSLKNQQKLKGKTVLIVDISGSMQNPLGHKSDLDRYDAACALAILVRESCESVKVYATAGNDGTMVHATGLVPARRGFALRDSIKQMNSTLGGGGIFLTQVMDYVSQHEENVERVIVITDEQDCDRKCNPQNASAFGKKNYILNISVNQNGIAYNKFTHINGWSESVLEFIRASEELE